mgnify:CR=1 FL=1
MHKKVRQRLCHDSEELKREAIKRYYTCLIETPDETAQQAFMYTCKLYSQINPDIPDWRIPKEVAMILIHDY